MTRLGAFCVAVALSVAPVAGLWPGPAVAQDSTPTSQQQAEDKSSLETWLQEQFSGTGRKVEVQGFSGALSAQAQVAKITVADDTGVWLEISDIVLDWSRSALLSGAVEIEEFSAARIDVLRLPVVVASATAPEVKAFQLPDLPVSINIGELRVDTIALGPDILGEPFLAKLTGNLALANGEGQADILVDRTDGTQGRFAIVGSYANETDRIDLDLLLTEAANGLTAKALDLPGLPSVDFAVQGRGTLDDFVADITLATDGTDRLTGTVDLTARAAPASTAETPLPNDRVMTVDLSGDVTALFLPAYRDFFGPDVQLATTAIKGGDGTMTLQGLDLQTRSLRITGNAELASDGWPQQFELQGVLADPAGTAVLLPISGAENRVKAANLTLRFDATQGNEWQGALQATGFERPEVTVTTLNLSGGGTIKRSAVPGAGAFDMDLTYAATGTAFADPGVAKALGENLSGQVTLGKTGQGPLTFEPLTLSSAGLRLMVTGVVAGLDQGFHTTAKTTITAQDFGRFDLLTGLALGGSGTVDLDGDFGPLDGTLHTRIDGAVADLVTGIAQLDPVLRGAGTFGLTLTRNEAGVTVEGLTLKTDAAEIAGDLTVSSTISKADIVASLTDIGLVMPDLSGPAQIEANGFVDTQGGSALDGNLTLGSDRINLAATQDQWGMDTPAQMFAKARIADLAQWSRFAGRALSGSIDAQASGVAAPNGGQFDLDIQATAQNLRSGSPSLDQLIAGTVQFATKARRPETGGLILSDARLTAPNLSLSGNLNGENGQGQADFQARIADMGVFTPDFSGPLSATGTAALGSSGSWTINTDAQGPGGTAATISGTIGSGGTLDLRASGQAPLGLLNAALAPRRLAGQTSFDLSIIGPPQVSSITGTLRTADGAISDPDLGQSLEPITGTLNLAGDTATLDMVGQFPRGGQLALVGTMGLTSPNSANLVATIDGFVLRDPDLYETTLSGQVTVIGPLAGGAAIKGQLDLGPTELQVPSTGVGSLGDLPDVTHVGPASNVTATLSRAGALGGDKSVSGGGGAAYPIEVRINAPSRVFIRGRGLDAELGGSLTLRGTTAELLPQGQFNLIRGRLDLLQQRFNLTEGSATLQGNFVPVIRLLATTTAPSGTIVTIAIQGEPSAPEITFSSAPELPQDEVLAQLIFGRNLQSITPLQAVQLAAAVGTLAGRGGNGVVDRFRQGIGVDDFDVATDEDGNAAIRAGKYLSENVYADVTLGTNGTSSINLNLDVTNNLTARGSFGNDGETSVGVFFEKDY